MLYWLFLLEIKLEKSLKICEKTRQITKFFIYLRFSRDMSSFWTEPLIRSNSLIRFLSSEPEMASSSVSKSAKNVFFNFELGHQFNYNYHNLYEIKKNLTVVIK